MRAADRRAPRPAPLARVPPALRWPLVLLLDAALATSSLWLTMVLRFEGQIPTWYRITLPAVATLLVSYRVLASLLFRLHRWSFRLSGLADGARILLANLFGTGLFVGTFWLLRDAGPPRSVVVLELLLSTLFMALVRFSPRLAGLYARDWARRRRDGTLRTLIVGAGAAGERLLRELQHGPDHGHLVVGFVDDDPAKWSLVVGGRTVLGGIDDLHRLVLEHQVDQLLIAIPQVSAARIRRILSLSADLQLRFKILPGSFLDAPGQPISPVLQELSAEDLLPREPVRLAEGRRPIVFDGRPALVTGAAGSLGREIVAQLLRAGAPLVVMADVDENGLYLLGRRFQREHGDERVALEVTDVRDGGRVLALFAQYRPRDVFHAAAHKHVPLLETAPGEAVKNNVLGTRHVLEAAHAQHAERLVYLSTDKAVRPTSVMGASKRVGEELVRAMARRSTTRFCAVRFGNVLGSAGSVVPLFREQIAAGGPVTVTHPEVRRYFMTVSEAVALVLQTAYAEHGELCVLDMGEQIRIVELARHMITMAGRVPDVDVPIVFTGLRPGEKLAEDLLTEEEERTRRVERKIFVADCPAPSPDLETRVDELIAAALAEDPRRVVRLLRRLVPTAAPSLGAAILEAGLGSPAVYSAK